MHTEHRRAFHGRAIGAVAAVSTVAALIGVPRGSAAAADRLPRGAFASISVVDNGKPVAPAPGTHLEVGFGATTLLQSGGCNTPFGHYRFSDGVLHLIGEFSTAGTGCEKQLERQDEFLFKFLAAQPSYRYDGHRLELTTRAARIVFGPFNEVEPPAPLTGTTWEVTHVTAEPTAGGPAVTSPADDDPNFTIAKGRLTGGDGCSAFTARASITGSRLHLGALRVHRTPCTDPPDTRRLLAVLHGTLTWRIDHGSLQLSDARGSGLRAYAPAYSPFHGPVTDTGQPLMQD